MAITDKLVAIADAIRGKTGKTTALTLDEMPVEIAGIQTGGGGGNANTYSGEIVFDAETSVTTKGLTLNLGLPSRAKWFFMWFDKDDFAKVTPTNNKYGAVIMIPVTASDIIPFRVNATTVLPDTSDRLFFVGSYYNAVNDGYGLTGLGNLVTANTSIWAANEDGTITLSRFGAAGTWMFAGTYHWIAVC